MQAVAEAAARITAAVFDPAPPAVSGSRDRAAPPGDVRRHAANPLPVAGEPALLAGLG